MEKIVKVSSVEKAKAGKADRIILHYTGVNGESFKPGVPDRIGNILAKLDEDSRKKIATLKMGDIVLIEMKKDEQYWNLTKVSDAPDLAANVVPEAPAPKKHFDDVGIKVGAARNQAIAYLSATAGGNFTLDDVDSTAYEIVSRQAQQEAVIRSNNNPYDASREVENVGDFADDEVPF